MKKILCMVLISIMILSLTACSYEETPDKIYEMNMVCAFSGETTETKSSSIHGYSYGSGGYVYGHSHYTVNAEHYYVVAEKNGAYFLIDFSSNITTFLLAANQPSFKIIADYSDMLGVWSYYYCRDKNPKKSSDIIYITSLSEEEANIYVKVITEDLGENVEKLSVSNE